MTLPWSMLTSPRNRVFAFLATASPLRYGLVVVVFLTLWFSWFHIIPMIHQEQQLLHDLDATDQHGLRLEDDLQFQIEKSRRSFLRLLLAHGDPAAQATEMQFLQEHDAAVAQIESKIAKLGTAAQLSPFQFHESWLRYQASRDRLAEADLHGAPGVAAKLDPGLAGTTFAVAQKQAGRDQAAFEASYAAKVQQLSGTLKRALQELYFLVLAKLVVLSLLIWIDWRRVRAEKGLKRATHELRASEDRFRQAYETATVGMGIFKLDGTVLSANAKAAQMLGYEVDELIGMKVSDFMAPECVDDHRCQLATLPQLKEKSYQTERRVIRKDGAEVWVRNSVTLLKPEGQEPHVFSISEEITHERRANERLAFLANFDPVTNLPNRHFFEEQLASALQLAAGKPECVALLYLEIDSFDFLKGTFGRNVADEVLGELGSTLSAFQMEGEIVARLDDHVFGMLMLAAPYDEATLARAGELRDIFHRASESGKHRIPISASIGIAYSSEGARVGPAGLRGESSSRHDSAADTLIKFARAAMLEARSRGGDSIFVADPSLQERAAQRHQIESALLRGLREDEFRVVFQPQFEIATGKLVRFEALCRWTSAELGTIPPDRFIPIAEQTGLISEIGRRVMLDALRQAGTWAASGRKIGVAVNISPMQFMRPDFTSIITEALAQSNFPSELLELEITEGIFIRDLNLAVARIRELQRLGLSIALDDFGTGYSSLSYLQRMPIDAVKLDRSFVSDLTTDPATVSMVRSVLAMARALNLRVVTEGVETEEQLEILRELGCDEAQGYLLGRPESAELALQRVLDSPMRPVGTLA
jgi:PAS domain S-box-containing protein/diguanylate cyclase (GGDEF)-like protein